MLKTVHQQRIEEFMKKAGQEVPAKPTIPSKEIRLLRAKLILEEALETISALGFSVGAHRPLSDDNAEELYLHETQEPNFIEIADGCADLSVVTIGTLSACGIQDVSLLQIVDESNLAKFEIPRCPKCGVEMAPVNDLGDYICNGNNPCNEMARGPYRRADGKWIKSPTWQPPCIAEVLAIQAAKPKGITND